MTIVAHKNNEDENRKKRVNQNAAIVRRVKCHWYSVQKANQAHGEGERDRERERESAGIFAKYDNCSMFQLNGTYFSAELLLANSAFCSSFIGQFQLALTLAFYKDHKLSKPSVRPTEKEKEYVCVCVCVLLTFLFDMQIHIAPILNVAVCNGRNFKYWHLWRICHILLRITTVYT